MPKEGERLTFYWLLLEVLVGRKPIADLLAHEEFLKRGERICRYLAKKYLASGASYDWRELFQDACVKVLKFGNRLVPSNIPDEAAFFRWFFVLVRNLLRDEARKNGKRRELEMSLSDDELKALKVADPGIGPEGDCLLSEFRDFTKDLPEEYRRAIELRQEGRSYEEIAVILKCTKVTVRNRVKNSLDDFFADDPAHSIKKRVRR